MKRQASISPPPRKRRKTSGSDDVPVEPHLSSNELKRSSNTSLRPQLRIYSWNVNGIAPFLQPTMASFFKQKTSAEPSPDSRSLTSLRQVLKRQHWPQILFLQEVKMHPEDASVKRAVESAVNKSLNNQDDGPTYTVRYCLPKDKYNARGFGRKVYGVAAILRNDFVQHDLERVREVDWDLEGRVLIVETEHKLAIFNIYAVNGTDNVYKDSSTGKPSGTRHDRKLAFHRLLAEEGQKLEQAGFRLVIAGDLNVAPAPIDGHPKLRTHPYQHVKNREDFHSRFLKSGSGEQPSLDLVDSFRHLHPNAKKYSWVSRNRDWLSSCDRVDHILVSRSLVTSGAVKEADVLMTPADRGPSDHCPVQITLEV